MLQEKSLSEQELTDDIAEECFLLEAIYYMAFGYVPYKMPIFDYDTEEMIELRTSEDQFCKGSWMSDVELQYEISKLIEDKIGLTDPVFKDKYRYAYSGTVEEFEKLHQYTEIKKDLTNERRLLEKYIKEKGRYYFAVNKKVEEFKHELFLLLKRKILVATGLFTRSLKKGGDFENDDDWIDTLNNYRFEDLKRLQVNNEVLTFDCIDWENNIIQTTDGKEYSEALISFKALYNARPQFLDCKIKCILRGSRILYNNRTYIPESFKSVKGRKGLNWDLFYQELIKTLLITEKGILPKKQETLVNHMQNWCIKSGFSNGSRGSIQPKISEIYKLLQSKNEK